MLFTKALLVFSSALAAWALDPTKIKADLSKAKIIPDVLDDFDVASELRITYHLTKQLSMGTSMTAAETETPPHVWFPKTNEESQYTLVMFDADASRPLTRQWIVTNIDGQKPGTSVADMSDLHQYTRYQPVPQDSQTHRYVFALFEQSAVNQTFVPPIKDLPEDRSGFDIKEFATKNNLKPVTAVYMNVQN